MNGHHSYSPPLSVLSLCPPPVHRRPSSSRPTSIVSKTSYASTFCSPPPSSFHENRRSRSVELLNSLTIFAPPGNSTDSKSSTYIVPLPTTGRLTPSMAAMTAVPPHSAQKKPGFFRRLSLSTQNHPSVQPASQGVRSSSGTGPRNVTVGGPSYEAIPATSAPSAFRPREGHSSEHHGRSLSKDPNMYREDAGRPGSMTLNAPTSTPIATAFSRSRPDHNISPDRIRPSEMPRNPIHPALASPPRKYEPSNSASSPYNTGPGGSISPDRPAGRSTSFTKHVGDPYGSKLGAVRAPQATKPSPSNFPGPSSQSSSPLPPPHGQRQASARSTYIFGSPPPPQRASATPPPMPEPPRSTPARPVPSPLIIPHPTSASSSRPLPRSQSTVSKFADAEPASTHPLPAGAQAPAISTSPHAYPDTRGRVSARRTASSSNKPNEGMDKKLSSSPDVPASHTPRMISPQVERTRSQTGQKHSQQPEHISEASAYARAVAATLAARPLASSPNAAQIMSSPSTPSGRRVSRPLPAPPVNGSVNSPQRPASGSGMVPKEGAMFMAERPTTAERELPARQRSPPRNKRVSSQPVNFDFPRSPTLPPLIDPRKAERGDSPSDSDPITTWAKDGQSPNNRKQIAQLSPSQLAPRASSASASKRAVSSPLASPDAVLPSKRASANNVVTSPHPMHERAAISAVRPPASLLYVLSLARVQATLLPHLTINSFLSLIGSSDTIRRRFTGEAIGRWVMREWALQLGPERGRSWPNLTVWEGFLESLLHDPSTYSTYSPQWYSLLQHLSLSHTLIVLHLRQLPATVFPNPPPLPFDDDSAIVAPSLPFSSSTSSFGSTQRPRSRLGSAAGSDAGSVTPSTHMPRQVKLMEIIMPEPLASQPSPDAVSSSPGNAKARRRGSIGSIASVASMSFGRRRSNSTTTDAQSSINAGVVAAPMLSSKGSLPPVSYPTPKRYAFTRHGEPSRPRTSSDSGRPGSVFSVQSSPTMARQRRMSSAMSSRASFAVDSQAPPVPGLPSSLGLLQPIGGGQRGSFASSDAGRSSRRSDFGNNSPINGSTFRRDFSTSPPIRVEPAFEGPIPYVVGRAPVLRVFVPLSEKVQRWPSVEGCTAAVKELEKCGALRRLRLGDLVVNTALRQPESTEHMLIFVPFSQRLLVPLDYSYSRVGHLPASINGFELSPSYYHPLLSAPQIIYLDLSPFAQQALHSIRLAYDRRDVTVASGARLSAKRYLHVAGFEIRPGDRVAPEWHGMVSLEAEGTAEGKKDMESRLISTGGARPIVGPWEVMRDKCMLGTIWLRLVREVRA